ncbi:hypothetical protein MRB53_014347 [Persea americana]|uniref:Uncharacterized protein n=1 Tax=Persea americana TaxID=3435 RepID=A0ACC2KAQ2_PERAE|nr:hypothetical protein MRB53_014347 [Persea americana]
MGVVEDKDEARTMEEDADVEKAIEQRSLDPNHGSSKRQSSLTSTSKGKHITLEAKSEDKPKDDSEIIPDDGIVGDGPETLMVRRSMLAPREVEDGPEIEEINNDEA